MDSLPPLRALQVFDTLGRCGGVVETARRLGVSPGAVSQQIKILEEALGMRLLTREGKRLRLTSAGLRYHETCAAAFESLRVASSDIERAKNKRSLSVSALPSLLAKWLAPRVYEWQDAHPELDIYLDGTHSEPSPDGPEIDFRITYGERINDSGTTVELFRDSVVPVCSPRLLSRAGQGPGELGELRELKDMLGYPLLSIDWFPKFSSPPSWREYFAANGIACPDNVRINRLVFSLSGLAIQAAVEGHGFVLAQTSMIVDDLAAGRLVLPFPVGVALPSPYFLTWQASTFDQPHCRAFHRWLLTRSREQQEINERMLKPG
jgi:LysR family glycine cleavage system transcriptional activator